VLLESLRVHSVAFTLAK